MKVRTRDFIYTTDDLFFASTNYIHPYNRFISFLRYIPDINGDRKKDGESYSKVTSKKAYEYLRKNYPEYLYFCDITQTEMMGVPFKKVKEVIKPENRLKEIKNSYEKGKNKDNKKLNPLFRKLLDLSDFFHYKAGIPYENLGISGSILPNLQKEDVSDIDFVVYGLNNHRKAMDVFKKFRDKEIEIPQINKKITLNRIQDSYWERIYKKRMKDLSLSKEEFCWYEDRKNNRGLIEGVLFDILATRDWNEIGGTWGDTKYYPKGSSTIQANVESAIASFDNPAIYTLKNLKVIEGLDVDIKELVSFTHTYAGQTIEKEEIIAKGKLEKVLKDNGESSYRLVVGTTRESIDEFIKLKNSPIPNKN
ncbi:MAG: DNA polymerase subunit beta [Methanobacteriaceae archaeon]|jgi:predicted nucleotidyltransferase|nr:DNA polymerase subunit beta [Candidatus Methanorudis spinitermitis]